MRFRGGWLQPAMGAALVAGFGCASKLAPPTAAFDAPATAHVRLTVQLDGSKSAPASVPAGEQPLPILFHWSLIQKPAGSSAALTNDAGPAPRLVPDLAGAYVVRLTVSDFAHESAPVTHTIQANDDCAPQVTALPLTTSANVGQPVALGGTVTAPCSAMGDTVASVRWTVEAAPPSSRAKVIGATRLNGSFVPDVSGPFDLALRATDALGFTSAPQHVLLNVMACGNNAPQVDTINATPSAPGLGAPVQLTASVSDADTLAPCSLPRTYSYAWSFTAVPKGSAARLTDPLAQTPSFTPDVAGDYVVTLTASDQAGRAGSPMTITITASACGGSVPIATATGPVALKTGDVAQLSALVADADKDVCNLPITYTYAWSLVAAPARSSARLNDSGLMNPSFTADAPGTYAFSVIVTSSNGHSSAPALVSVTADVCGSVPPVIQSISASSSATGLPLQLSASIADANGCKTYLPFTYRWTLTGMPAGSRAALNDPASAAPSFVPDVDGVYTARLDATDALGLAAAAVSQTFTVSKCNAQPAASISAPAGAGTGSPVALTAAVADSNDPVICQRAFAPYAYAWSLLGAPAGSTARLNNAAVVSPSFVPDKSGTYTLALVVTDAAGNASVRATKDVTVANCNAPLSAAIAAPVAGVTGVPIALGLTGAGVTDPNSACAAPVLPYSYAWSIVSAPTGSKAVLNNPSSAAPSFVPDVGGPGAVYQVQLVITDAAGNKSPPITLASPISIAACNVPLTITSISPLSGTTRTALTLSAAVNEPNSACASVQPWFTWSWTLTGRPAGSAAAFNNGAAQSPSFVPDVAGTYSVSVVATDSAGNSSPRSSAVITVANCSAPLSQLTASYSGSTTTGGTVTLLADPKDPNPVATCGSITPIAYQWTLIGVPPGSKAGLATPLAVSTTLVPDLPGTYVASVRATDALGNKGATTTSFAVSSCGSASNIAVAVGASPAAPILGQSVTASAVVNDTNAGGCGPTSVAPFAYAWTLTPPSGSSATLSNAAAAQPVFAPDVAGSYALAVTVTDALGYQKTGTLTVTAKTCTLTATVTAPSGPQLTYQPVHLVVNASDSPVGCAGTLSYAWSFASAPPGSGAKFNSAAVQDPTFTPDAPNASWTARADVRGSTGERTFATGVVTSNACGSQMPIATAGISLPFPISVSTSQPDPNVGSTVQYLLTNPRYQLQLDGSGSSQALACNAPLSWNWTVYKKPLGSTAQVYPVNAVRPVFAPDVLGDFIFQLTVGDGRFTSGPSFLRITVVDPLQDAVAPATRGVIWNDLEAPNPAQPSVQPAIAYFMLNAAGTFYDLMYSQCTANCASASPTWSTAAIETGVIDVNNTLSATAQVSLKFLPGGTPIVAYRYDPSCQMHYALFDGSAWQRSVIDNNIGQGGCLGEHGEIQLMFVGAAKTVAVAYHSHSGGNLRAVYAVCTAATCKTTGQGLTAASWSKFDVDTTNNAGHWIAAYIDPVTLDPNMAYHREVTGDLWYAGCTAGCTTGAGSTWAVGKIAAGTAGAPVGLWNSIALDSTGKVGVAYEDTSLGHVRLATCTSTCAGGTANWTLTDVASPTGTGFFPSLQYDALNLAHITFIDAGATTLRYAIQNGASSFQYFDIDHQVDDGHSSFILTPFGSTHVSYSLTTGLKYYPFGD